MSDWNEYPVFDQLLAQKIAAKKVEQPSSTSTPSFDPYKTMMMKKDAEEGKPVDTSNVVKWPEEDIRRLEEFCKMMGIANFSCGRMPPLAALAFLKQKLGVVDGTLENRTPIGYEKLKYNSKNPYKKDIIHG